MRHGRSRRRCRCDRRVRRGTGRSGRWRGLAHRRRVRHAVDPGKRTCAVGYSAEPSARAPLPPRRRRRRSERRRRPEPDGSLLRRGRLLGAVDRLSAAGAGAAARALGPRRAARAACPRGPIRPVAAGAAVRSAAGQRTRRATAGRARRGPRAPRRRGRRGCGRTRGSTPDEPSGMSSSRYRCGELEYVSTGSWNGRSSLSQISFQRGRSSQSTSVIATPCAPARAVRPMRWT